MNHYIILYKGKNKILSLCRLTITKISYQGYTLEKFKFTINVKYYYTYFIFNYKLPTCHDGINF